MPPSMNNLLDKRIKPNRIGWSDTTVANRFNSHICNNPPVCDSVRPYTYPTKKRCAERKEDNLIGLHHISDECIKRYYMRNMYPKTHQQA